MTDMDEARAALKRAETLLVKLADTTGANKLMTAEAEIRLAAAWRDLEPKPEA